jgi:hypothetical protein
MEPQNPTPQAPSPQSTNNQPVDPMLAPKQPTAVPQPEIPAIPAAGAQAPDSNVDKTKGDKDGSKKPQDNKPVKPAQPKDKNVTIAIIATVVIVLGLAAMAVYAFTKQ